MHSEVDRRTFLQTGAPSRVDELLSLSRVKSLSLVFSYSASITPKLDRLSRARVPHSRTLEILNFRINILLWQKKHSSETAKMVFKVLSVYLFPLLNPVRVVCDVQWRQVRDEPWIQLSSGAAQGWSALELLDLRGCLPYRLYKFGLQTPTRLFDLPAPVITQRRDVRLHSRSLFADHSTCLIEVIRELFCYERDLGLDTMQPGSVTLVVPSDDEKNEAEAEIQSEVPTKWRSIFVVEVED